MLKPRSCLVIFFFFYYNMSVIDLKSRITNEWEKMHDKMQDQSSLVYIDPIPEGDNCTSMDLQVGSAYILPGSNQTYEIPVKWIEIKPRKAVVIYTKQRLKLPFNVFGVVTGKGSYIFRGCFLSTGKIDPAFDGHLKIGFLNESNSSITLKPGDKFATAFFMSTESTLKAPLKEYQTELAPAPTVLKWYEKVWYWLIDNWKVVLPILISILTLIVQLLMLLNKLSFFG